MPRDDADDEIRFSPFGRDPRHTQLNPEDVEFLDEEVTREQALSMIGKVWAGNAGDELFRLFDAGNYKATFDVAKAKVAEQERLVDEVQEVYYHGPDQSPRLMFNTPCPVCGEPDGFHNEDVHRKNIDPKYLLEKGWHNVK